MEKGTKAEIGMTAFIRYKGGIKGDDTLVDDRSTGDPLPVLIGAHRVPKGVEDALCGMVVGEQKTVTIPPELGYGRYVASEADWYPRALLPNGYDMKVGDFFPYTDPQNELKKIVHVTEATEDGVKIDFNHPFAGKELEYWIELVDLR